MSFAGDILNNRETATVIWISIFFAWVLTKNAVRSACYKVLKGLFNAKIILCISLMLSYVCFMVFTFNKMGFWDISKIKETLLWTVGVAFVMLLNVSKASDDEHFFRKTVFDSVKIVLVIEFIVNLYSFSLVAELILVPVVSIIAMITVFAERKPEHKQVENMFNFILCVFGIGLIIFSIYQGVIDFGNIATLKVFRDFLLSPVFTITFLPFVYLMALLMEYEATFLRIKMFNKDSKLVSYTKLKILIACHFDLRKLNKLSKEAGVHRISNRDDVLSLIRKLRSK